MVKIISEIGINHNGSIQKCKDLMMLSKISGCDYVKIQKRNPHICISEQQKKKMKETPWGLMTYLDYKLKIEFSEEDIKDLVEFSKMIGIELFASVWDIDSVKLMSKYSKIGKIPSALITNLELCRHARNHFDVLIISTGMSSEIEIENCINECNPDVIMHTNSTYPSLVEDLNLNYISWLKKKWKSREIGYSGHELGLATTFASVAIGATWIERHVTLDKNSWGTDQSCSVEPHELYTLVRGIRDVEKAIFYEEGPRLLFQSELDKKLTLHY
jgi:N-acetylneuraminate synthase